MTSAEPNRPSPGLRLIHGHLVDATSVHHSQSAPGLFSEQRGPPVLAAH